MPAATADDGYIFYNKDIRQPLHITVGQECQAACSGLGARVGAAGGRGGVRGRTEALTVFLQAATVTGMREHDVRARRTGGMDADCPPVPSLVEKVNAAC